MNKNYNIGIPTNKLTNNKNPLVSTDGFKMVFARAPNVQYFLQSFNIPSVTVNEAVIPYRQYNTYVPGDRIQYDPLTVTMLVSEDMENFQEIFSWLNRSVTLNTMEDKFDDLTIYVLTSKNNANKAIMFKDVFPTSIGNISFQSTDSDVVYATVDVTFRYNNFTFE
jgi:hypothetical protein